MDWDRVPAYLRPVYQRDDPGLLMPYRWSPRVRDLWRTVMEEGRAIATTVETPGRSSMSQGPRVENIRRHAGASPASSPSSRKGRAEL